MHNDQTVSLQHQISQLLAALVTAGRASEPAPDGDRLLRWPEVHHRVQLCHSRVYTLMGQGLFPRPRALGGGRAVGWSKNEIDIWIATREVVQPQPEHPARKRRQGEAAVPALPPPPLPQQNGDSPSSGTVAARAARDASQPAAESGVRR